MRKRAGALGQIQTYREHVPHRRSPAGHRPPSLLRSHRLQRNSMRTFANGSRRFTSSVQAPKGAEDFTASTASACASLSASPLTSTISVTAPATGSTRKATVTPLGGCFPSRGAVDASAAARGLPALADRFQRPSTSPRRWSPASPPPCCSIETSAAHSHRGGRAPAVRRGRNQRLSPASPGTTDRDTPPPRCDKAGALARAVPGAWHRVFPSDDIAASGTCPPQYS